jgi:sensor histidine kinase YesM
MLQPLVENSIKHGLDRSADRMEITIEAMKRQNDLLLRVADNGRGCSDPKEVFRNGGIGLRNVRERLSLLYGKNSDMVVTSSPGKGFSVTITIPYDNHGFNLS